MFPAVFAVFIHFAGDRACIKDYVFIDSLRLYCYNHAADTIVSAARFLPAGPRRFQCPEEVYGMDLKQRATALKTDIPAVFLALKARETPAAAKIAAGVTVLYALSPIDLIPDFIPVLGYLDDVLVLPALIALTLKLIPADVLAACRAQAKDLQADALKEKWYCAIPVVLIWALAGCCILRALLR